MFVRVKITNILALRVEDLPPGNPGQWDEVLFESEDPYLDSDIE